MRTKLSMTYTLKEAVERSLNPLNLVVAAIGIGSSGCCDSVIYYK